MTSSAYQGGYNNQPFASPRPSMQFNPAQYQQYQQPVIQAAPIAQESIYVVNDDSEFKSAIARRTGTSLGLGIATVIIVSIILLFGLISMFKLKKHVKPTQVVV